MSWRSVDGSPFAERTPLDAAADATFDAWLLEPGGRTLLEFAADPPAHFTLPPLLPDDVLEDFLEEMRRSSLEPGRPLILHPSLCVQAIEPMPREVGRLMGLPVYEDPTMRTDEIRLGPPPRRRRR